MSSRRKRAISSLSCSQRDAQTSQTNVEGTSALSGSFNDSIVRLKSRHANHATSKAALLSTKTPMYDNVFMLSTEGQPMCTISMKKAKWYLKKGIAEWSSLPEHKQWTPEEMEGGAKCIRLLFEHNGLKERDTTSRDHRSQCTSAA
ncbi:hypothetical protein THAOC_11726 [Thalassiosira oceanica]|uniref:Uncharacterized protein n=1 Tax=Thalassiosira oceanica TaxID=159749 RepID=K0T9R9_THAOC|nr:hypothetical protein THAOC_11726 [Thalassiosira oceanica]|eukprot:EJK67267.1 hypothetical protein THAOC_11726 [Thalassiosira oceanica]